MSQMNYQNTTYQNPLSTRNSQYFGDADNQDYAHVKKIRFLKNRVISLEDKVLELKKELALKETVHETVKKELKEYKKIVKGLEGIDPNILNLEIENDRLRTNFKALLQLKTEDFSNLINIQGVGEAVNQNYSNLNMCLNSISNHPDQCHLMKRSLEKLIV